MNPNSIMGGRCCIYKMGYISKCRKFHFFLVGSYFYRVVKTVCIFHVYKLEGKKTPTFTKMHI